MIKLKGGAGFAVGLSIRDVIHAVALDQKRILPVSSLVDGTYGIRDVCLSVPTVVGRKGVESQLEIELWPKEVSALAALGARCCARRSTRSSRANPRRPADGEAVRGDPRGPRRHRREPAQRRSGPGDDGRRWRQRHAGGSRVTISGQGQGRR